MMNLLRNLLVVVLLLLLGCRTAEPEPAPAGPATTPLPTAGAELRFLSLGDSYTIGQSVPADDRWSVQLARQAQQQGLRLLTPDIIARTGWTTADLRNALAAANPAPTYDLVSLLIGVNNQYQGLPLAAYRVEFRELLATAARLAGNRPGRVVVLSTPDWGRSPYAQGRNQARIAAEIDAFNAVAREECQQVGIAFVDITPLTREAAGNTSQFAPDGLHYSGLQMAQWAQLTRPVVQQLLK